MKKLSAFEGYIPLALKGLATVALGTVPIAVTAQVDSASDEDIYELSPFTVDASQDEGYRATSTLAGSRINTQLKDVASSISVITKDFLKDIDADDAGTLLNYTTGTEVGGAEGNYLGTPVLGSVFADTDDLTRSANLRNRIRGLASADSTRDFFLTNIPWDSYNVDRVDINRGSNSFLYGLGSAAGIINTNTINPNLDDSMTHVEFKFGRFGSMSTVVDHNQPIIEGKLAARIAIKRGDERFMQQQAFQDDTRAFLALEYKPFENTRIKLKYEDGEIDSNKPDVRPPLDQISHWMAMGQPILDYTTNSIVTQGTVASDSMEMQRWMANQFWVGGPLDHFSNSPDEWDASLWGIDGPGAVYFENWGNNNGGAFAATQGYRRGVPTATQYYRSLYWGQVGANKWTTPTLSDPTIFDFYENMAVGNNKWEAQSWDTLNVSIEQKIPVIDAVVEATFDRQDHNNSYVNTWNWQTLAFFPDINSHMQDGRPNPNVGRPYMSSAGWSTSADDARESMRLTAYKQFDFEDVFSDRLGKMLGTHAVTLNYQEYEKNDFAMGGRPIVANEDWNNQYPIIANSTNEAFQRTTAGQRAIGFYSYVGEAVVPGGSLQDANIRPVSFSFLDQPSVPITYFDWSAWQVYTADTYRLREGDGSEIHSNWAYRLSREEVESSSLALQSSILDDAIVSTLGWREDEYSSWRAPGPVQDGFVYTTPPLATDPDLVQKEGTFAYGIVARLPNSLRDSLSLGWDFSLFYNQSDNFSPTAPRIDLFTNDIPPPTGETEEYGVMISSDDNKMSLRLTSYETSSVGESFDNRMGNNQISRGLENAIRNIITAEDLPGDNVLSHPAVDPFVSWLRSDASAYYRDAFEFDITYGPDGLPTDVSMDVANGRLFETRDSVSEGYELEVTYNPLQNWRMALNFAKQEAVTANSARTGLAFLELLEPDLSGVVGTLPMFGADGAPLSDTLIEFDNSIKRPIAGDGFPNFELRENRMNFVTNYSFNEGKFAGLGIGGAVRWQDEVAIGNGYKLDPDLGEISDLTDLHYGPSETNFDAWVSYGKKIANDKIDWKVQLNVRNIGVGKELIPVATQPDGTVAVSRIAPPMTWTIRNSFDF